MIRGWIQVKTDSDVPLSMRERRCGSASGEGRQGPECQDSAKYDESAHAF
jgi:hypothetical protein